MQNSVVRVVGSLWAGSNFGREQDVPSWTPEEALVNVSIGGVVCGNAQRVTRAFQAALQCEMGKQTVRRPGPCVCAAMPFPMRVPVVVCWRCGGWGGGRSFVSVCFQRPPPPLSGD
jgi:hypothetical protein